MEYLRKVCHWFDIGETPGARSSMLRLFSLSGKMWVKARLRYAEVLTRHLMLKVGKIDYIAGRHCGLESLYPWKGGPGIAQGQ